MKDVDARQRPSMTENDSINRKMLYIVVLRHKIRHPEARASAASDPINLSATTIRENTPRSEQ
jgi:hypothetical protein